LIKERKAQKNFITKSKQIETSALSGEEKRDIRTRDQRKRATFPQIEKKTGRLIPGEKRKKVISEALIAASKIGGGIQSV